MAVEPHWQECAARVGIRSALVAPIVHGQRSWGAVCLSRVTPGPVLNPDAASLFHQVVRQTAPILHNEHNSMCDSRPQRHVTTGNPKSRRCARSTRQLPSHNDHDPASVE